MRAAAQPEGDLRAWLRELREAAGLSQEELAAAVGTDRRNIHRWEVQGHDPGGTVLLRLLAALGVRIEPAPPAGIPLAVNAELRSLRTQLGRAREQAAARHSELLARLDAQEGRLGELAARLDAD